MGFGDPDHRHPLNLQKLEKDVDCFRCQSRIYSKEKCYGCTRCNHFVHHLCYDLPEKMRHLLHSEHTLTLLPSPSSEITNDCNHCHKPFLGGFTYSCQECLKFDLHLKCFQTLNLETKHSHPLSLYKSIDAGVLGDKCRVCGLLIDHVNSYSYSCEVCDFLVHFECTLLPPKVEHRHVHELTFEYNYPEGSKIVDCDVCLDEDGEELDRTLSYYYCEKCDYIAHVRCVTSKPKEVTTQFDYFVHEHPMICVKKSKYMALTCDACQNYDTYDSFYLCSICNYALHKSCAQFPRFIKHPSHNENHTFSLQSTASHNKNGNEVSCELCSKELDGKSWILQCSDCNSALHLFCASQFEHPLCEDNCLSFSSYDTKYRCNACGELDHGCRLSERILLETPFDLHVECFGVPGQIEHGCHSHPLYLVLSSTEIKPYSSSVIHCDICQAETDPDFWIYCCIECKYIVHLKCVVSNLLPELGLSSNISSICSIKLCERENFRVRKPVEVEFTCLKFVSREYYLENPVFRPGGLFNDPKPPIGYHNAHPDATDVDKPLMDTLHCPKCEQLISVQAYSNIYDWVHCSLKASIYNIQNETRANHESLALLDDKVVDELYCPICNLLIFPPTYSCDECQIFFHRSCAELPRKCAAVDGHTLVLQSLSMKLGDCSQCKRTFKGYGYFCAICEIGFDVTCALGAPRLKLGNRKHSLFASTKDCSEKRNIVILSRGPCEACEPEITGGSIFFKCVSDHCDLDLHFECAMLPSMVKVKRRIHHHPLVLEPHLDLSVDDYICDVCEDKLNPCIWVYRCSDICGDRATFHVSCIVTSNKKKSHFVYDEECSYPHLDHPRQHDALEEEMFFEEEFPNFATLKAIVDELEHEYTFQVMDELRKMDQAELLRLVELPDALREKVAEAMKHLTTLLPDADDEVDEDH